MFSGLVWRGTLRFLRQLSAGSIWVTTGIVIRKMISSTSITSTSGVVLMVEIDFVLVAAGADVHRHGAPLGLSARGAATLAAPISTPCRSPPKVRTASIATLLRRTSQL